MTVRDTKGRGHWVGVVAMASLGTLVKGGTGQEMLLAGAAGLALAATLALFLFFHARLQPPCWQLERKTGREFYRRQAHTLWGLSCVYWAPPLAAASLVLAWLAVHR